MKKIQKSEGDRLMEKNIRSIMSLTEKQAAKLYPAVKALFDGKPLSDEETRRALQ